VKPDLGGGDKVRTREQIETNLITIMARIAECNRVIKAAEEAQRRRDELRRELAEVAAEYADVAQRTLAVEAIKRAN
jgi:tRNA(Ser,Leu) C12 N-acetylase TAN1